ncbi:malate dehydrogenase (quinone) [Frigidibacter sp. MR17.14]|uniref:malate dehydrogenase (quinone) n=1 Tax=Frigidibacter sp. MR17.14 TaxID=3126509 RepID=UPI003012A813
MSNPSPVKTPARRTPARPPAPANDHAPSQAAANTDAPRIVDVLLIGGGIMSATLGVMLNELEPDWTIHMVERLDEVAMESSNGWNNAGTGHSALCELNYTPEDDRGTVRIESALHINESFQVSRRYWAHQVERGVLSDPQSFIRSTPHVSFVWGEKNVDFLRRRHAALDGHPLFAGMKFSTDPAEIADWVPLMMEGRDPAQPVAATWAPQGTDVNFGEITRQSIAHLRAQPGFSLSCATEVSGLKRGADGLWEVKYSRRGGRRREQHRVRARFVFIGAGGGSLPVLQMSGIPEARPYAGFPVGGSFLVCETPEVVERHMAKAYGKAPTGAPPMSVPHLDTRILDGKRVLLFGPFATFSTRFLKEGSLLDLPGSMTPANLLPMLNVGTRNFDLVRYLAQQLAMSKDDRMAALRDYFPGAKDEDWRLWQAGQRVQVIKHEPGKGGVLKPGTEVVSDAEGTIAALLGASPGASTAAPIMVSLLRKVFPERVASPKWAAVLEKIVPGGGAALDEQPEVVAEEWSQTGEALKLEIAAPQIGPLRRLGAAAEGRLVPVADMAL